MSSGGSGGGALMQHHSSQLQRPASIDLSARTKSASTSQGTISSVGHTSPIQAPGAVASQLPNPSDVRTCSGPLPPPLSEDAERRLVLSEWVARMTAEGISVGSTTIPPDVKTVALFERDRDAASYHEAGLLGMDPDGITDKLREGTNIGDIVTEYKKRLRESAVGSQKEGKGQGRYCDDPYRAKRETQETNQDSPMQVLGKNIRKSKTKKRQRLPQWMLLGDKGKGSETRKKIDDALYSIGAF